MPKAKTKAVKNPLKKKKSTLRWLKLVRHLLALMPIAVIIIFNFEFYTKTTASTVSLGVGTIIGIVFFILKALGRFPKNIKGIIWSAIFTGLAWGLKSIIYDLPVFATGWLIGSILTEIISIPIKKLQKEILMQEQAETTSAEVVKAIRSMPGGGRV